ncbi:MAG: hypothetical protein INH41_22690 [Myxococcaceae bacterium]|nr:hypothetical protein [Myxococcaceae bacterium]MCA3015206.1 hypothetical protein [Myxococcaceae bacterium]
MMTPTSGGQSPKGVQRSAGSPNQVKLPTSNVWPLAGPGVRERSTMEAGLAPDPSKKAARAHGVDPTAHLSAV